MFKHEGMLVASASDIVNYLGCTHRSTLDLIDLETPLEKAPDDEQMQLVQDKGRAHEAGFLEGLRAAGGLVEIAGASLEEKIERTREAMRAGAGVIYQAALREGQLIGHADFLRRVEGKSELGGWRYEVLDTKLALKTKAKFLIQLACYSDLVAAAQGVLPERAHLRFLALGQPRERVTNSIQPRCGSQAEGVATGGVLAAGAGGRGGGIWPLWASEPVATPGEFAARA